MKFLQALSLASLALFALAQSPLASAGSTETVDEMLAQLKMVQKVAEQAGKKYAGTVPAAEMLEIADLFDLMVIENHGCEWQKGWAAAYLQIPGEKRADGLEKIRWVKHQVCEAMADPLKFFADQHSHFKFTQEKACKHLALHHLAATRAYLQNRPQDACLIGVVKDLDLREEDAIFYH